MECEREERHGTEAGTERDDGAVNRVGRNVRQQVHPGRAQIRQQRDVHELHGEAAVRQRIPAPGIRVLRDKARHPDVPAFDGAAERQFAGYEERPVQPDIQKKNGEPEEGSRQPLHRPRSARMPMNASANNAIMVTTVTMRPTMFSSGVTNASEISLSPAGASMTIMPM